MKNNENIERILIIMFYKSVNIDVNLKNYGISKHDWLNSAKNRFTLGSNDLSLPTARN